jgi:hypothetical protein
MKRTKLLFSRVLGLRAALEAAYGRCIVNPALKSAGRRYSDIPCDAEVSNSGKR